MDVATAHASLGNAASAFLAGQHQLLIGGKWADAKSGKRFDVFDPATGQAIAAVAEADAADVEEAVKAARHAFEEGPWSRTSPAGPLEADLEARGPLGAERRRDRPDRIARQRQADPRRAPCRLAGLLRDPALHGRLGNQDQRRHDHGFRTRRLACLHVARTDRRRRSDHPVEFPVDDGGVEDRSCIGRRLHHRAEACRADAAQRAAAGSVDPRKRAFRRAWSTS